MRHLFLALCLCVASPCGAAMMLGGDDSEGLERVEAGVWPALRAAVGGRVNVLLVLEAPELVHPSDLAVRQEQVFELQESVLVDVPAGEFELGYRYQNIPGLTAWVSAAGLEALEADLRIAHIGLDRGGSKSVLGTSSDYVQAPAVHALGFTGAGQTVAVLDTGIDTNHPDLSDNLAPGAMTFLLQQGGGVSSGAEDDDGHGTHVSGIITSKGVVAGLGVAPDADILAIKVLDSNGFGQVGDWAAGVDYVISVKSNYANLGVINMSLATFDNYAGCPCNGSSVAAQLMHLALQAAKDSGIVNFAASGNDGECFRMNYPGCDSATESVGAVYESNFGTGSAGGCSDSPTAADLLTCFSNRNACSSLAAPGYAITSSGMGGGTSTLSGTSFATPHCAAGAALLRDKDSSLTPDEIATVLAGTGSVVSMNCGNAPPRSIDLLNATQSLVTASVTVRLGSPPNVQALLPGATGGPLIGTTWDARIDHTSFVTSSVLDLLVIDRQPANFGLPNGGTLLVNFNAASFTFFVSPGASFDVVMPLDYGLAGLVASAQGASFDAPGSYQLTNALDLVAGWR